ncbi:MAG: zinc ribbon domain-containing protein, partial [bacterium]|nr:zinc ribbon domain-containing protein [bacterium]
EMYEGKHETIITKQLFDSVQEVLRLRGKPERKANDPQALCGLLRCATCRMMVTAEQKTKYQKNGNIHHYTYYRCSKKSKVMKCSEPCIREEELDRQLSALINNYALPSEWAAELSKMTDKDEQEAAQSSSVLIQEMRTEIQAISQKLQRLLTAYLDQDIEREVYRSEKAELLSRKKSLEEEIAQVAKGVSVWIEPLREWIKDAQNIDKIVSSPSLILKKVTALKIFGLNLTLHAREARGVAETQWASIAEAHCLENKIPLNLLMVSVYRSARTHFSRNVGL